MYVCACIVCGVCVCVVCCVCVFVCACVRVCSHVGAQIQTRMLLQCDSFTIVGLTLAAFVLSSALSVALLLARLLFACVVRQSHTQWRVLLRGQQKHTRTSQCPACAGHVCRKRAVMGQHIGVSSYIGNHKAHLPTGAE